MDFKRIFMLVLGRPLRTLMLLCWIALGLLILASIYSRVSLAQRGKLMRVWSRLLLRVLGVNVHAQGGLLRPGTLVVANHVSWLDPFVLLSLQPLRFVAKAEVRRWPVFGWLAARAGTVFIRREQQRDVSRVALRFTGLLEAGESVALFPESTTGDGSHLMPFKTGLFQVAISQSVACIPVALNYEQRVAIWIDDMGFVSSVWHILGHAGIDVRVQVCPEIPSAAGMSRRDLARASEQAIAIALSLPIRRNRSETPADPPA